MDADQKLPQPHPDFDGRRTSTKPSDFAKRASWYKPNGATLEQAACTVARYALRLIDKRDGVGYTVEDLTELISGGLVNQAIEVEEPPVDANALIVTGTLTDGTNPVVFPPLFAQGDFGGKPFYLSNAESEFPLYGSSWQGSFWDLSYQNGSETFEWYSNEDVATPDLVGVWTPIGPATGTPTVTATEATPSVPGQAVVNTNDLTVLYMALPGGGFAAIPRLVDGQWLVSGLIPRKVAEAQWSTDIPAVDEKVWVGDTGCSAMGDGTNTLWKLDWTGTHEITVDSAMWGGESFLALFSRADNFVIRIDHLGSNVDTTRFISLFNFDDPESADYSSGTYRNLHLVLNPSLSFGSVTEFTFYGNLGMSSYRDYDGDKIADGFVFTSAGLKFVNATRIGDSNNFLMLGYKSDSIYTA